MQHNRESVRHLRLCGCRLWQIDKELAQQPASSQATLLARCVAQKWIVINPSGVKTTLYCT